VLLTADAHRDNGKRFTVRADEKLTAFLELERITSGSLILGHGEGQLAAVTFLGISLVVADVRAVPGCELMAISGAFFGKDTELACLIFSPLDRLERKLRSKRGV